MTGPVGSKADTIEQLRRRMAQIPARSAGPSRPSLAAPSREPEAADQQQSPPPQPSTRSASSLRTLPAPAPIAELLPHHGLVRGSTVHVSGAAALRVGLIAAVTGSGGWAALIASPDLGLLAATEMGGDLRRCALVPNPGPDPIEVAAILVDGLDLVVLSLGGIDVPPSRARAVTARVRRNGAVLVITDGRWPTVDQHLGARVAGYRGLEVGHGRITGVDLAVEARARGQQPRRATVAVTGQAGAVTWTTTDARPAALKVAQ
ncbi:hypothetical protein ABIC28_005159 [Rhodococcus sp. PvR044]|uniref:hypothetical protein n=1 Tax=Rhodococcus sp. PvR044 TaxID=3156402 RepID=UPI0033997699